MIYRIKLFTLKIFSFNVVYTFFNWVKFSSRHKKINYNITKHSETIRATESVPVWSESPVIYNSTYTRAPRLRTQSVLWIMYGTLDRWLCGPRDSRFPPCRLFSLYLYNNIFIYQNEILNNTYFLLLKKILNLM